ncbi:MAG TPA: hypothetical protein ENG89_00530 [Candidatus Moranbacteria bacterium]|nr:hypothetical protein [Candidatus Moranbacteria bacterium]
MITKKEKKHLLNKLKRIQRYFNRLEKIEENEKIKDKAKKRIVKAFQKHINRKIDKLIKHTQKRSGKGIDPETANQLMKDLEYIKFS